MAAFAPYSARNAKIRVNGVTVNAKRWTATPSADLYSTQYSEGAGFETGIFTRKWLDVEIECDDDGAANLYDAGLVPGATVTNVRLYLNDVAGPYFAIPSMQITSAPMMADAKTTMGVKFTGKAAGSFTLPTGNAGSTS